MASLLKAKAQIEYLIDHGLFSPPGTPGDNWVVFASGVAAKVSSHDGGAYIYIAKSKLPWAFVNAEKYGLIFTQSIERVFLLANVTAGGRTFVPIANGGTNNVPLYLYPKKKDGGKATIVLNDFLQADDILSFDLGLSTYENVTLTAGNVATLTKSHVKVKTDKNAAGIPPGFFLEGTGDIRGRVTVGLKLHWRIRYTHKTLGEQLLYVIATPVLVTEKLVEVDGRCA